MPSPSAKIVPFLSGLRRLGHEVYFIEPIREGALRPAGSGLADSENAAYFRAVVADFGLEGRAALLLAGTQETVGLTHPELRATLGAQGVELTGGTPEEADAFVNGEIERWAKIIKTTGMKGN